ncbi:hypothetical protein [Thomasclavelia sp.]|uniref:hypothetical protein n=1 Tax=Thomasclavelia sp. TaxID=3025757 RepID=UPI0025E4E42A|nr:hypothetical protein [Thomasclavelia sp.]
MLFKLHFNNNLDDKFLKELKKKSKNTLKFNSKQYKLLSKIADENIKKDNYRYAEIYAKLVK